MIPNPLRAGLLPLHLLRFMFIQRNLQAAVSIRPNATPQVALSSRNATRDRISNSRRDALRGVFPRDAGGWAILDCLLDALLAISREIRHFDVSRRIHDKDFRTDFKAGVATGTAAQIEHRDS